MNVEPSMDEWLRLIKALVKNVDAGRTPKEKWAAIGALVRHAPFELRRAYDVIMELRGENAMLKRELEELRNPRPAEPPPVPHPTFDEPEIIAEDQVELEQTKIAPLEPLPRADSVEVFIDGHTYTITKVPKKPKA